MLGCSEIILCVEGLVVVNLRINKRGIYVVCECIFIIERGCKGLEELVLSIVQRCCIATRIVSRLRENVVKLEDVVRFISCCGGCVEGRL